MNKEKNLKKSITDELSNIIDMHEKEVEMRLRFESKLNNLLSMYRELESRFLIISKEFQINGDRMTDLFNDLSYLKQLNKNINKESNEVRTLNKK